MLKRILFLLIFILSITDIYSQRIGIGIGINRRNRSTAEKAYYISYSTGNDSNDGLTPATAKKTFGFSVTDSNPVRKVYFKRGDTWPQFTKTIAASADSITIGAYGTGEKPKLKGSKVITGWTKRSTTNVYVAKPGVAVTQLFVNGVKQTEARYPNSGYDYIETVNTTSSFTSNELNASINYAGAKWIGRTNPYAMPTVNVSSSSSKTITLAEAPFGDLTATTEGFILVGKFELLDEAGEWFYNTSTDSLYFWADGSVDPDELTVTASVQNYGFSLGSGASYLTVKDLDFSEYGRYAIYAGTGGASNNTIQSCDFDDNNYAAIFFTRAGNSANIIKNNTVKNSTQMGIELFVTNSLIEGNQVDSIALFANLGGTGIGNWYKGSGIYTEGAGNTVQYNDVENVGYNGIHFYYPSTIQYNYVHNCNLTKDDGGGIYTSSPDVYPAAAQNNGSIVRYNIIDGSWGTAQGFTTYGYTLGEGIYLDESSGGISVYGNSVGNVTSGAYYAHKGYDHLIRDNVSFRARYGLMLKHKGYNIIARKNKLYGFSRDYNDKQSEQMVWKFGTTTRPTIDSNTYVQHYKSADIFMDSISTYSFANWKTATGKDAASTVDNSALTANYSEKWVYNNTKSPKTFYLNNATNVTDAFTDASITGSFVLQPYTSRVIEGLNVDCVQDYQDAVAPEILGHQFLVVTQLMVRFYAGTYPSYGVTKFIVTDSNNPPLLESGNWVNTMEGYGVFEGIIFGELQFTFDTPGTKTLYVWARDAAGNVSEPFVISDIEVTLDLKTGLIATYEFEDSGTTLVDSHTNGLNGTNKNASNVDYSATPVAGKPGNAYSYSGATFRYSIVNDNELLDFSGTFSIAVAVNPTTLSSARGVFSKRDGTYSEFELYINANGSVSFTLVENGNNVNRITCTTATGVITAATDNLIVLRSDGTDRKAGFTLNVNGVNQSVTYTYSGTVSSDLSTGIANTTAPFSVGTALAYAANMTGKISQLAIWNYSLPDAAITDLYDGGNFKSYTNW